jgi:hypothetical protein
MYVEGIKILKNTTVLLSLEYHDPAPLLKIKGQSLPATHREERQRERCPIIVLQLMER